MRSRHLFLVCMTTLAAGTVPASAAAKAYMQPEGPHGPYISKRSTFEVAVLSGYGTMRRIKWTGWGTRRAIGRGRATICSSRAGYGCVRKRRVKIVASQRRAYVGAVDTEYVYCRVTLRGKLGPARPGEVITLVTYRPGHTKCQ